jgi:hypothetical protein
MTKQAIDLQLTGMPRMTEIEWLDILTGRIGTAQGVETAENDRDRPRQKGDQDAPPLLHDVNCIA